MRFRNLKKQAKNKQKTEKIPPQIPTARFVDRIKAFITDMFMINMPISYFIGYVILDGKDEYQSSQLFILMGTIIYMYIYSLLISKFGQTPGKKAYEMKIVDSTTYKQISFFRALFRCISFLISATSLIGLLLPLVRKDKRSLHDIMAKTTVIVFKSTPQETL